MLASLFAYRASSVPKLLLFPRYKGRCGFLTDVGQAATDSRSTEEDLFDKNLLLLTADSRWLTALNDLPK